VGVLSAGGAVMGLGTFGAFTDSTTPVDAAVDGGVVSIDLRGPGRLGTVLLAFDGVLPGGATTRTVSIVNDGSSDLASVTMTAVATVSSVLDTDRSLGLQMTVRSCSVPWSPETVCAGAERTVLPDGPVIREAALDRPASLAPGRYRPPGADGVPAGDGRERVRRPQQRAGVHLHRRAAAGHRALTPRQANPAPGDQDQTHCRRREVG